jgi:hypothetical protein
LWLKRFWNRIDGVNCFAFDSKDLNGTHALAYLISAQCLSQFCKFWMIVPPRKRPQEEKQGTETAEPGLPYFEGLAFEGLARMSTAAPARRDFTAEDFGLLAAALRAPEQPQGICQALDKVSCEVIGHRLFTVMRFRAAQSEVERIYSNMPSAYPAGGRKTKKDTAWAGHVLGNMKVFRGNDAADIRAAFDDHATILGLGLGSVLNIPVVFDGRCLGTMNLLHQEGWYRPEDERAGLSLAAFLIPVLLDGNS